MSVDVHTKIGGRNFDETETSQNVPTPQPWFKVAHQSKDKHWLQWGDWRGEGEGSGARRPPGRLNLKNDPTELACISVFSILLISIDV